MQNYLVTYARGLVGQYYQSGGNKKLAIYLGGTPSLPASPDREAGFLTSQGYDLLRPDYYGYARSAGFFSTQNCVQTVVDTVQYFRTHQSLVSVYAPYEIIIPVYEEIILIGSSYGGWVASASVKFISDIDEIVLLFPRFSPGDSNQLGHPEESDEDFLRQYMLGYQTIYRIHSDLEASEAFLDIGSIFNGEDLEFLAQCKVFVGHGSADDVVRCGRSRQFIDKLRQQNPQGDFEYAEYYGLGHGGLCKQTILHGWMYRKKKLQSL